MSRSIELKVFGALRRHVPGGRVELQVDPGTTVADLREKLRSNLAGGNAEFSDDGLLDSTAFASNEAVLGNDEPLDDFSRLSALPPVCGG